MPILVLPTKDNEVTCMKHGIDSCYSTMAIEKDRGNGAIYDIASIFSLLSHLLIFKEKNLELL